MNLSYWLGMMQLLAEPKPVAGLFEHQMNCLQCKKTLDMAKIT
jgi:hypothetical protein